MKMLNCMFICIATLIILSCSKKEVKTYEQSIVNGIKITESSTTPADSTFKVVLKEVCFINNDTITDPEKCLRQPSSMDFDDHGNLFVLDRTKYKVFKYDTTGKLVKTFGGQGMGPGEFIQPGTIIVRKDTLFVTDFQRLLISKFNLNGEYIAGKQFEDVDNFPHLLYKLGEKYITYGGFKEKKIEEGKIIRSQEILLYNKNMDFNKIISKLEYDPPVADVECDITEKGIIGAASSSEAYVYEFSKTDYKIDVYDINGKKVREIRKKYTRLNTSEEIRKTTRENGEKQGKKRKHDYWNSILNLYADKYNRLWVVCPSNDKEYLGYYDVFENDIFINRIKLDFEKDYYPRIVGNKIIGYNGTNNNIKIYEY